MPAILVHCWTEALHAGVRTFGAAAMGSERGGHMRKADKIAEALEKRYADMVDWRRYLHRNPELSFEERRTAAWIAERLRGYGCEVAAGVGGHGVVAVIRGG